MKLFFINAWILMHMLANAAELADYQKTGELFYQDVARKIEIASGSRATCQD